MVLPPHTGSVADHVVQTRIENVPSAISGARYEFSDVARIDVSNWVGTDIGSPVFDEKYLPAMIDMTMSEMANAMRTIGTDAQNVKIGEFTIASGKDSNIDIAAGFYERSALAKLKRVGGKAILRKARG